MTNEEKAIELHKQEEPWITSFTIAMQMGEWKDEQFNKEKKDLLELVNMLECNEKNQTIIEDLIGLLK